MPPLHLFCRGAFASFEELLPPFPIMSSQLFIPDSTSPRYSVPNTILGSPVSSYLLPNVHCSLTSTQGLPDWWPVHILFLQGFGWYFLPTLNVLTKTPLHIHFNLRHFLVNIGSRDHHRAFNLLINALLLITTHNVLSWLFSYWTADVTWLMGVHTDGVTDIRHLAVVIVCTGASEYQTNWPLWHGRWLNWELWWWEQIMTSPFIGNDRLYWLFMLLIL
jgi:hypothetical protein